MIGSVLAGSDRPFIVTSGTALAASGRIATEADVADSNFPRKSEEAAALAAAGGARVSVLRLPPSVHGVGDHGFVPLLIRLAREKGVSAYVGEGLNRWPAVPARCCSSLQAGPGEDPYGAALPCGRR
jgi:hypothetical protein